MIEDFCCFEHSWLLIYHRFCFCQENFSLKIDSNSSYNRWNTDQNMEISLQLVMKKFISLFLFRLKSARNETLHYYLEAQKWKTHLYKNP